MNVSGGVHGPTVRALREKLGVSQERLAARAGLAMQRGYRLSEVVSNAVRNWLMAHGAPGAWVQVAIQQRAGSDAENHREASAFFSMVAREPLRASTGNLIAREAMVGRWGSDWREGDVVDTVHAVVMSAVRDLGPQWQSQHADVIG